MEMSELKMETATFDRAEEIYPLHGSDKLIRGWKAIWNIDKDSVATVVSEEYNLVQHKEVVDSVANAVSNLNIPANASIRDDGNKVVVDIEFKTAKMEFKEMNETFIGGIRVINSYNKSTGIVVAPRLMRVACLNGMVVSKGFINGYTIRHTEKMTDDMQGIIERMLKSMVDNCDRLKSLVNNCIGDSIEWEMMERIINNMASAEKHAKIIRQGLEKKIKPGKNLTRWDMYNAFTAYATHGEQLTPNIECRLQAKAQQILQTPLVQLVPQEKENSGGDKK